MSHVSRLTSRVARPADLWRRWRRTQDVGRSAISLISEDSRPYGNESRSCRLSSAALASFVVLAAAAEGSRGRCAAAVAGRLHAGGGHAVGVEHLLVSHAAGAVRLAGLASGAAGACFYFICGAWVGLGMGPWRGCTRRRWACWWACCCGRNGALAERVWLLEYALMAYRLLAHGVCAGGGGAAAPTGAGCSKSFRR